jgi:hypothetical protein
MKKFTFLFLVFHLSFFTFHLSEAQILRVPSVYPTIQAAVDAAGYGDTVLVAPGTYQENILIQGNAKILILASNFIFSGDTNDINNTIIDASQPQNPNFGMGILLKNQDSVISPKITGFTITGGTGYYKTYGGGIYSSGAIPIIEYNHIQDCSITGTQPNGGGIYIGGGNPNTICVISHNVIKNCTVTSAPNGVEANGAGMSLNGVKAVIDDNKITGNIIIGNSTSNASGGGIFCFGNLPWEIQPYIIIKNNEISNNTVESQHAEGGGVWLCDINGYTADTIEGNTISYNEVSALSSPGAALGGGILIINPLESSVISDNIISDNRAIDGPPGSNRWGGGIYLYRNPSLPIEYNSEIKNNRITGNIADAGAGITCESIGLRLLNNFISGNQAGIRAGVLYCGGAAVLNSVTEVINNTITSNSATAQGGEAGSFYFQNNMNVLLMNNIFYGNQAETSDEIRIAAGTVKIHNCDINSGEITGTWTGEHNFNADPEFIDEMAWDCWANEAPCSNAGIDKITAYDQLFEAPVEDILGNERPQDGLIDVGAREVNMCFVGLQEVSSQQSAVSSYPNPLSTSVTFKYTIEESGMVTMEIFNQVGQLEVVLVNELQTAGTYQVPWDADGLPAGIYYYSLRSGKQVQTGKIIVNQ